MFRILTAAFLAAFILSGCVTTEPAQPQTAEVVTSPEQAAPRPQLACFERGALIKHLDGKFDEHLVAAGLAANGSVLEVFASPDGITWTIVLTQPNGATCVMASGEGWMGGPMTKKGKVS